MGHIRTFEDILVLLRRRWKVIVLCVVLAVLIAVAAALKRQDRFVSWASIEVQGAQVEAPASSGTPDTERARAAMQLVKSMQNRLTSRPSLLAVIERHGLFTDLPALSTEEKVNLLRGSISFTPIEHGFPPQITALVISVTFTDAENAARIANDMAQGMVDLSAAGAIARAEESYAFHSDRLIAMTAAIDAQEARIVEWRNENAEALPPIAAIRREEMAAIETELRGLERDLLMVTEEGRRIAARETQRPTDRQRLRELDDQAALIAGQQAALQARTAEIRASLAGVAVAERGLSDLERELLQLQRNYELSGASLAEADAGLRLAEGQQGERFGMLDRAITPEHAQGPRRIILVIAGAIAGVMGGLVLAFLLDLLKPVIRTSAQLERDLGLRPIIALPDIRRDKSNERRLGLR